MVQLNHTLTSPLHLLFSSAVEVTLTYWTEIKSTNLTLSTGKVLATFSSSVHIASLSSCLCSNKLLCSAGLS